LYLKTDNIRWKT